MAITNKKYLDNSGLIKILDNLNEQFNRIPFKKLLDTIKSASYLFDGYDGVSVDDLIKYDDTSNVTNMSYMFRSCYNLTSIPLLDTSHVTNMSTMFGNCSSLTTIPELNTSNVVAMGSMFNGCSSLTTIPQLDTSKVTYMGSMFDGCSSLTSVPLLNTSNVTNMESMFYGCNFTTMPELNTGKVRNMSYMFYNCSSLTTIPAFDTSNVTNMTSMFYGCTNIEQIHMINIGANLNISYCTKMERTAVVEVLNNLKDLTDSTSKKLTLGSTLLAKLTDDDKLIATNKNWTLA